MANNSFKNIDPNLVLLAAILGVGGFVAYKFFGTSGSSNNTQNKSKKDIDELTKGKGVKATHLDTTYASFADQLYQSMRYIGTNEGVVYSVLNKMKNDVDVLKLLQAFGRRGYIYNWYQYNLPQWIVEEFNKEDIDKINQILRKRDIQFRF